MALPRVITMLLHCTSKDYRMSNMLGGINFDRKRNLMMASDGLSAIILRNTAESVESYLETLAEAKGITDIPDGDTEVNIVNGYGNTTDGKRGEFRWKIGETFPNLFNVLPIGEHTDKPVTAVYDAKRFDLLFRSFKHWSGHDIKLNVSNGDREGPLMQYGRVGNWEYVLAVMPVRSSHYDLGDTLPENFAVVRGVPEPDMAIANRFVEIANEPRSI